MLTPLKLPLSLSTLQAEAKKAEGNTAFAAKDYETAIGFYSEVIMPQYFWLMVGRSAMSSLFLVFPDFQAIALDPSNHVYYSNRSICYAETGKLAEAKDDGEKCVTINPAFVKGAVMEKRRGELSGPLGACAHRALAFIVCCFEHTARAIHVVWPHVVPQLKLMSPPPRLATPCGYNHVGG